ncbi:MAG: DUF5808 domain-containing protein [Lysobacterales bacterium]|jgi:uncharacterized membrane protein
MNTSALEVAICVALIALIVFYRTIITGEWRNAVANEEDHWYFAIFYFNPEDKRLFLPKRSGLGWTINFAQPLAIVILVLLIVGLVALARAARGA